MAAISEGEKAAPTIATDQINTGSASSIDKIKIIFVTFFNTIKSLFDRAEEAIDQISSILVTFNIAGIFSLVLHALLDFLGLIKSQAKLTLRPTISLYLPTFDLIRPGNSFSLDNQTVFNRIRIGSLRVTGVITSF